MRRSFLQLDLYRSICELAAAREHWTCHYDAHKTNSGGKDFLLGEQKFLKFGLIQSKADIAL